MIVRPYLFLRYTLFMATLISISVISACGGGSSKKVNCDDFDTQPEAQAYFLTNNAENLDRDNDGIACEHLPDGGQSKTAQDLNYFIGTYVLLGESCEEQPCSAQALGLTVNYDNKLAICLIEPVEQKCASTQLKVTEPTLEGYRFRFDEGEIRFKQDLAGHVTLNLNGDVYYGNRENLTDKLLFGDTSPNNTNQSSKYETYVLSSILGQKIEWDKISGMTVSHD